MPRGARRDKEKVFLHVIFGHVARRAETVSLPSPCHTTQTCAEFPNAEGASGSLRDVLLVQGGGGTRR